MSKKGSEKLQASGYPPEVVTLLQKRAKKRKEKDDKKNEQ